MRTEYEEIEMGIKSLSILRALAQMVADGKSITIAPDWGLGTATVIIDGMHTHVGNDLCEEKYQFEMLVDGLFDLLVESRGLSWVKDENAGA